LGGGEGSFRLALALAVVLLSTMHNKEQINTESKKEATDDSAFSPELLR